MALKMKRYSAFAVAREALRHHAGWERAWKSPAPRARYDVVIVGAGGHGLATAYYLGKRFGITNVAVIEKGWLGGGNTGRNTTIIRSNYLQDPSAAIYEKSRALYEDLSQDLNYNVMFSPRGVMMLARPITRCAATSAPPMPMPCRGWRPSSSAPSASRSCARSSGWTGRAIR
jgi:sarcosine oxidase subunit beta